MPQVDLAIRNIHLAILLTALSCSANPRPGTPSDHETPNSEVSPEPTPENAPQDEGSDCGGMQGLSCKEGQFCLYAVNDTCGAADQMGKCTVLPEACTMDFSPVCGCDDRTYSNACNAYAKGVSVASEGECTTNK
jgi:hypothetical protein